MDRHMIGYGKRKKEDGGTEQNQERTCSGGGKAEAEETPTSREISWNRRKAFDSDHVQRLDVFEK